MKRPLRHARVRDAVARLALCLSTLAGWTGLAGTARAQAPARAASKFYPDFSDTADALLRNAASHARDHQWAEAIDIYQRVVQQYGDKVAKLPKDDPAAGPGGDSQLYVDLRQFCQRKLAALPPEARAVYRNRVDAQAERWFRQGEAGRDRSSLRRVLDQAFASSWGDDAADLLGDLAYQDGRFEEALSAYRMVVADDPGDSAGLTHPDPSVDRARVAAKKLLCRAALAESVPGADEVAAFAQAFPNAEGSLAGRTGPLAEVLAEALRADSLAPPAAPDGRWPTFAGSPSRSRVVAGPIDVGSLQWRVDLEPVVPTRNGRGFRSMAFASTPTAPDRLLAYHPIVLGDQVVVSDGNQIVAYNLNDRPEGLPGTPARPVQPVWKHEGDHDALNPQAARMLVGLPRHTLTAFGDKVFARMGPNVLPIMGRSGGVSQSSIVAIDRESEGKLLWKKTTGEVPIPRRAAEGASRNLGFEGTPVADARGVYVALTDRREQTATYVACFDPDSGLPRWVRYLGAASSDADNMFAMGGGMGMGGPGLPGDFGHRLLSLEGPTLYYQTNLGAVVALDTESGSIRWVATYPRLDRSGSHERDLNPAIVHNGLVLVAPEDASAVYAFAADSGRFVWKTDPLPEEVKLTHLLGVAKGRLIATGDRVLLFDVKTGKLLHSWPDTGQGYEGFGRGVLAGDKIYWPTRNEIHVLDQSNALRTDPPIKLQEAFQTTGGNLAVGDGYLIVAQSDQLVVFCQNRRLIQRYKEEIAQNPDQAAGYFRMAQTAEATGQDDLALDSLDQTLRKARPSESIDGLALVDAARDHRYRLLMKMGSKAATAKDLGGAESRYRLAAESARVPRDRLRAWLVLAEVQQERGQAAPAVAILQDLLADEGLRTLTVAAEGGRRSVRSDILITDRLGALLAAHGRPLYARYDEEAHRLLEKGKADRDPGPLDTVVRNYPVSEAVPEALLTLGRLAARERPADAARAYKRLLALAPSDDYRARALIGLGRAYEAQQLWVPAREAYHQALARFASLEVEPEGGPTRVGPLVEQRLAQAPFDRWAGDRGEPTLPVPLARRWARELHGSGRPLFAEGIPPAPEASRVFVLEGGTLRPVDLSSGSSPWSADVAGSPTWLGYLDDRLLVGTETSLAAVRLQDGAPLWRFEAGPPAAAGPRGPDPFTKAAPSPRPEEDQGPPGKLHGFRVVGGRVFCLRGERELLAIDGDSGLTDWSFSASTGTLNPRLLVGPQRVVLQLRKPGSVLVLETATGRKQYEYARADDEDWPRAPLPLDDDHVGLVLDRRTVALFELSKGVNAWVFRESREMPKNGPPRLLGDSERLLLLHDGNELIRLDAATGIKHWSRPLGVEDLSERPDTFALDAERVYWVSGQVLSGASLRDGTVAWGRHLSGPETGWSVGLTDRCVLAFPGLPRKAEDEIDGVPLVFRRRDTGALVQRILLSAPVREVSVRLTPGGAVVATQSALWALGRQSAMDGLKPDR